ncbi:MAG: discoidin domain-containing protein, partial [Planctomycetes bacterium]|nr:discoidin domain-containing protein [Planctomycetota bacterium]
DNTPATPDYWGSDVDMTKLTDGVIAPDYSPSGACAGWYFSTADGPFGPTLYFDLGSIQNIGAVAIYHQPKNYGFETVRVSVSSLDNPNRADIDDMADWTGEDIHQSDHYGIGDGNGASVVQTVPIGQQGRWVRLQFRNQEWGFDAAWTMLSELTFYPE